MSTNIDDIMNSENDQIEIASTYGLNTYIENGQIFAEDAVDETEIGGGFNTPADKAGPAPVDEGMNWGEILPAIGKALVDYNWGSLPKDLAHGASIGAENINELMGTAVFSEGFNNVVKSVMGDDWYNKYMTIEPPKQAAGHFVSGFGQFLPGGIPAIRVMKTIAKAKGVGARALSEILGGFAGDYATSSKKEANDLLELLGQIKTTKGLSVDLREWMQNPDGTESDLKARLIAGVPGIILGGPIEGAISGLSKIAALAKRSGEGDSLVQAAEELENSVDQIPAKKDVSFRSEDAAAAQPDKMGYRSGLISALDELPENASADQILATLKNDKIIGKHGYKLEEIDAIGLEKFLAGKETFTRQEIADYIQQNQLKLDERLKHTEALDIDQETHWFDSVDSSDPNFIWNSSDPENVILGEGLISRRNDDGEVIDERIIYKFIDFDDKAIRESINREARLIIDNDEFLYQNPEVKSALEEVDLAHEKIKNYDHGEQLSFTRSQKKLHKETLADYKESLRNLRELLKGVGWSDDNFDWFFEGFEKYRVYDNNASYRDFGDSTAAEHWARAQLGASDAPDGTRHGNTTFPVAGHRQTPKNYKEILVDFPQDDKRFPKGRPGYSHFGDQNFFHVRTSERYLVDKTGKKLGPGMLVEETQSDLVQHSEGFIPAGTNVEEIEKVHHNMVRDVPHRIYGQLRDFVSDPNASDDLTIVTRGAAGGGVVPKDVVGNIAHVEIRGIISRIAERVRKDKSNPNILIDIQSGAISISGISNTSEGLKHQAVAQLLDQADVEKWIKVEDDFTAVAKGTVDFPARRRWLDLAIKRAIWEGVQEGRQYIAFPTNRVTIAMIEQHQKPASGALARTYEKDIPKILKRLAKKYGGTLSEGSIEGSPHHINSASIPEQGYAPDEYYRPDGWSDDQLEGWRAEGGKVTILTLTKEAANKIRKEGFALPSVVLGGGVASQLMEGEGDADGT